MGFAVRAEDAGVTSVVADWENKGKAERQKGFNTEVNFDTADDVRRLSHALSIPVTVRVNPLGPDTRSEVDHALDCGAGILMLPVASSVEQVDQFLDLVNGRAATLIQIETGSLVRHLPTLSTLPWDYAYLGLNDLMVEGHKHLIWDSITDGTVEQVCRQLQGRRYGFGGATIVGGGGEPIINTLILHESVRLGGSIIVLRRMLKRELLDRDLDAEMAALRAFFRASVKRGDKAKMSDHETLLQAIGHCG